MAAAIVIGELRLDSKGALEGLRRALKREDDPVLRGRAAEALGAIGPKSIIKDLRPLLKDESSEVREMAKHVLATSSAITAEDIAQMIQAKDERQRLGAIAVLGARGGAEERKTLLGQLGGGTARLREAIVDALRPMLEPLVDTAAAQAVEDIRGFMTRENLEDAKLTDRIVALLSFISGHESAAALIEVARHAPDLKVKTAAVRMLGKVHGARRPEVSVLRFLMDQLEESPQAKEMIAGAVDALSVFDLPISLEARARGLAESDKTPVRRWALKALGGMDSAPAAKALAKAAEQGDPTDRAIALEAALRTASGLVALAKTLPTVSDVERARGIASGLRGQAEALKPPTLHALEQALPDANPEVAQLVVDLLKQCGRDVTKAQDSLLDKALRLKAKGRWSDAAELFRRICTGQGVSPEARYQLGVCELKMSKRKISRGVSKDACLETFDQLTKARDFPVIARLSDESVLEPEDLYYLGFSLSETKGDAQGLGGDILSALAESEGDGKVAQMAKNKLQRMGWFE